MKIIAEQGSGMFIATVSRTEIEKLHDKYYGKGSLPQTSIGSEYDLRSDINYMGNSPYRFIHVCNQGREQRGRIYTVCFRTWGYYDLYLIGNNGIQAVSVDNQITRDVQDPIYAVFPLFSRSCLWIRGGGDTVLLASIEGGIIRLSHKV